MTHRKHPSQPARKAPAAAHAGDQGRLTVPNDPRSMDDAQNHVIALVEQHGYPKASAFALRLALHEAMMNAFKHGHKDLPATTPVFLHYAVEDARVELMIEDQGPGFSPQDVPDPTLEENIEKGSGRGLLLIKAYMSVVEYNDRGNRLRMVYERPEA